MMKIFKMMSNLACFSASASKLPDNYDNAQTNAGKSVTGIHIDQSMHLKTCISSQNDKSLFVAKATKSSSALLVTAHQP